MKKNLIILIMMIFFCPPSYAKEKITWMILDWPPWMILDGAYKGKGRFNHILNAAQNNLPDYEHTTERMNWTRFWHEVENNKNLCYTFGLKTGNRQKIVYYSAPHTFVLPNAIIMKKETALRLGHPESIAITELLKKDKLKGYAEKNRSFTKKVDSIMEAHQEDSNLIRVSESAESLIRMVMMGRADYTIEYPIVSTFYQKKMNALGSLVSIPIAEMDPFSFVYMCCTKNEWGKKIILKWNAALKNIKPTEEYRKITEIGHTEKNELLLIRQYYDSFVKEQN